MIGIIIATCAVVLSGINLFIMIKLDKHIAEIGGESMFHEERK